MVMALVMLAFWAVGGWVVLTLVRRPGPVDRTIPPTAEGILAERFARGELTTAQFEEQMATLRAAQRR